MKDISPFVPEFLVAQDRPKTPDEQKPGEYHWPKMPKAAFLEAALRANPRITVDGTAIDPDRDVVGIWYYAPSMAAARRAIDKALGENHGMHIVEMSTSKQWRLKLARERLPRSTSTFIEM